MSGNAPLAITAAGVNEYGRGYSQARESGLAPLPAMANAGIKGLAEAAGESIGGTPGAVKALSMAMRGNPVAQVAAEMGKAGLRDIPGESFTTGMQYGADIAPHIRTNHNPSWGEFGEQLQDTVAQTILQGGMMTGGGAALASGVNAVRGNPGAAAAPSVNYSPVVPSPKQWQQPGAMPAAQQSPSMPFQGMPQAQPQGVPAGMRPAPADLVMDKPSAPKQPPSGGGQGQMATMDELLALFEPGATVADDMRALQPQQPQQAPQPKPVKPMGKAPDNVTRFTHSVRPAAERVAQQLRVPVEAVIGQWGLETGWGRSIIPGTNNLGNIKDFSGKGVAATDNMTGSRDKYRAYGSVDEFAGDFSNLIGRGRYRTVPGSKNAASYFGALKAAGYAEDPAYVGKGVSAARMAAAALGKPFDPGHAMQFDGQAQQHGEGRQGTDMQLYGAAQNQQGVEHRPALPDDLKAPDSGPMPIQQGGIDTGASDMFDAILQNRDRSTPGSIQQMQAIAANPDYGRMGYSRDFANGAPVVAGDTLPQEQLGRQDYAVASDGRRIPVQYAVVEAGQVQASNSVDGLPNQSYGDRNVAGLRAIAGNGRIAGVQSAYGAGRAGVYTQELIGDNMHGIDPGVVQRMRQPVLVRVMPQSAVTRDIGDVSNTVGNLSMSAVEQARNDARRLPMESLQFSPDGSMTPETVRQFVRGMPTSEQGAMLDNNGQPTRQAVDRAHAAVFAAAYGNDGLVRLYAQAQDPEARIIMSALAQAAPQMARLEGAGDLDIRELVTQAAEIAVNARRDGRTIQQAAQQLDLATDQGVLAVLDLFAANPRSSRPIAEALQRAAQFAYQEAGKPAEDMFGAVPRATRQDVLAQLNEGGRDGTDTEGQTGLGQQAGREPDASYAGRPAADAAGQGDAAGAEAGRIVAEPERDRFTGDLFGSDGATADFAGVPETRGGADASRRAVGSPQDRQGGGSVQDGLSRNDVVGNYATRTELVQETTRTIGASRIDTPDAAARAMAYLHRYAVERFDALVTDAEGRPLAIVGSFKGDRAQASVHQATIVGEAFRIDGAANIWLAHNHPSGNPALSPADRMVSQMLARLLRGSQIKMQGIFAIGGRSPDGGRMYQFEPADAPGESIEGSAIAAGSAQVPIVERVLTQDGKLGPAIRSPAEANAMARTISGGKPGVILLDNQNAPVAFVPVNPQEVEELRRDGRMDAMLRAFSMANAGSAIIFNDGSMSDAGANNLAQFFNAFDVRTLDIFKVDHRDGKAKSLAELGMVTPGTAFLSRGQDLPRTPVTEIRQALRKAYGGVAAGLERSGVVTLVQTENDAIEAAAQARAQKRGTDVAEERSKLSQAMQASRVWHGTPHRGITQFSTDYIGTGEGAQAYGWGLYFASKREVGEWYRSGLTYRDMVRKFRDSMPDDADTDEALEWAESGDAPADMARVIKALADDGWLGFDYPSQALTALFKEPGNFDVAGELEAAANAMKGQLYEVEIPEDSEMLLWDKPLSEQPEAVQQGLAELDPDMYDPQGDDYDPSELGRIIYQRLRSMRGDAQQASEYLASLGIKGIKYLDGASRGAGEGSFNYVIFDGADTQIVDVKYSANGAIQGFYDPATGKSFLVADALTAESAAPVLLHEVGIHAAKDANMKPVFDRAQFLVANAPGEFFDRVRERMGSAGETSAEEAAAYLAEEYERDRLGAPNTVKAWIEGFLSRIRAWLHGKGVLDTHALKEGDIAAIARANLRQAASAPAQGAGAVKASRAGVGSTIDVDGVQRPTTNSNGQPIHPTEEGVRNFWRWFGDSKVVDAEGRPLVVYHGTNADFDVFRPSEAMFGEGVYLALQPDYASGFADDSGANVMPLYARITGDGDGRLLWDKRGGIFVAAQPEQVKSATGNQGTFDGANPDIRRSRAAPVQPGQQQAPLPNISQQQPQVNNPPPAHQQGNMGQFGGGALWTVDRTVKQDSLIRATQNNKIDLKRVVDAIIATGKQIADDANPYLADELYIGRVTDGLEQLTDRQIKPLLRAIADAGVDPLALEEYLHALHAEERNRQMAKINNHPFDLDYNMAGMSTRAARQILQSVHAGPQAADMKRLASMVHAITRETRRRLVANGLATVDEINAWEGAYKNYVPLMRDTEESGGRAQGYNVKGLESRRALGSQAEVKNILANVVAQAESSIIRIEKARVGRAMLQFAKDNPNPDFWTVNTPPTERAINKDTGLVETRPVPNFKNADNTLVVKVNGQEQYIVFNENNERAVALVRNLKNMDVAELNWVTRGLGMVNRYVATWVTSRNPFFWMTNFARDVQGMVINLQDTPIKGKEVQVMAAMMKAFPAVTRAEAGAQPRGLMDRYYREFSEAGGKTGYIKGYKDSVERMTDITREIERLGQSNFDPRKLGRGLLDVIDSANDVVENGVRLAVYATARQNGVSIDQAASIAKNITVNFNRKGNHTGTLNSLYMFANAGIQGNIRMLQAVKNSRRAQVYAGGLMVAGMMMTALNIMLGGDDEETRKKRYELVPEYERERSWIVMLPGEDDYVKAPLPIGPHIFFNVGRSLVEYAMLKDRSPLDAAASLVGSVLASMNPVGGGLPSKDAKGVAQMLTPSAVRPVTDMAVNQNFAGTPISKEPFGFGGYQKPAYTRTRDKTPEYWKDGAELLNDWTGGDEVRPGKVNITPEDLAYLVKSYTVPGIAQALDKTGKVLGDPERDLTRLPGADRFYGKIDEVARDRAAWDRARLDEQLAGEVAEYRKLGQHDRVREVLEELGNGDAQKGARIAAQATARKRQMAAINRRKTEARKIPDADRRQVILRRLDAETSRINARYVSGIEGLDDDGDDE